MSNDTFFVDLIEQHRDAHECIATALNAFAMKHWDSVGSRDPKPAWSPILWLIGWDVEDTPQGPVISAAFASDNDEPSILTFPAAWLDYYQDQSYNQHIEAPVLPERGKYGHLTVVK
jgi:hypothetical protein